MPTGTRKKSSGAKTGLSRRTLLAVSGSAAALPFLSRGGLWAAESENHIKVGFVFPRSGSVSALAEGADFLLDRCRKTIKDGLKIGNKTYRVKFIEVDSQSDPARAGQLAKKLVSEDKIDFMLVTTTPEVVNPVADVCEAAGVPCLSTVMPWESWYFGRGGKPNQPSPFKWTFHFSFGGAEFAATYIALWSSVDTNKKIGVMYPNDADGNAVRGFLPDTFKKAGFTIVDPGPFEDGTSDYSTQIALFKKERCEIINALVLPPDFGTFWRQAAQQGLTRIVKVAEPAKAGSSPSDIDALGKLGFNLCVCAPWNKAFPYKSSATGLSSMELANAYEAVAHKQTAMGMGASCALFDAGLAALQAAANPLDKAALAKAISTLKTTTIVGEVNFNVGPMPHVIAVTRFVGTQYQKASGGKWASEQVVIENSEDHNVPLTGKFIPYNAG